MLFGALALAAALPSLALARGWTLTVVSLGLLFLGCGLAEAAFAGPVVGVARLIIGLSVVGALLMPRATSVRSPGLAGHLSGAQEADKDASSQAGAFDEVFRFFLMVLALVAAFALSQVAPLSLGANADASAVSFFTYWMGMSGLLLMIYSRRPLRLGAGLIVLLSAANLLYSAMGSPGVATLLAGAALYLCIALAVTRGELRV